MLSHDIERVSNLTYREFQEMYVKKGIPVVFTNLSDTWSAMQKWNTSYFELECSHINIGAIPLNNGYLDLNEKNGSKFQKRSLGSIIPFIKENKIDNGWTIASPLEVFPEKLRNDCPPFDLCKKESFLRGRLFLGPIDIVTSLHQDLFENLYTVVSGEKKIILYHPKSPVYRNSVFSKIPNHAKVDPEFPNYQLYPKFKNAQKIEVNLRAGETLYIPSFWWHYLRNVEPTIAVSYWWSRGWILPIAWVASKYKTIFKI